MGEPKGPGKISQKPATPTKIVAKETKKSLEARIRELMKRLSIKYKIAADEIYFGYSTLEGLLQRPIEAFGSIDNLKGKRILDLGCGSINSFDRKGNIKSRSFEPWFCRALQELGANPVGVDISLFLEQEEFEHHRLDLLEPGALNIFPDQSFDGVNLTGLFDSLSIEDNLFLNKEDIERMKKEIGAQIKRLLKSDGKILTIKRYGYDDLQAEMGL